MNIKERLNITKKVQQNNEKQSNNSKLKFDNNIVINIISEKINNFNNIIFITKNTYNQNTVSSYFSNCINTENKINLPSSVKSIKNETINIFPSVSGELLVKILEQTLMGVKSFVLGICLNSYENVLEKLKTIISMNSNLSEKQINLLLSESNTLLVNVNQDETGTFYVKDIDKIQIENTQLTLNNLYTYIDKPEEETTQFEPVSIKNEHIETAPLEKNEEAEEQAAEEISVEDSINEIIEQNVISEEEITTIEDTKEDHIVEEENSADSTDITHTTDSQEQTEETKQIEPSEQAKIEPSNEIENETQNEVLVQNKEQIKEEQPLAQPKVNKYKLLKEKIRNKRNT